MALVCRICGNEKNNRVVTAREMMFGTREEFEYLECSDCGTVQILEVPDLSRHYPADYLSFDSEVLIAQTAARRLAAPFVGKYLLKGTSRIGKWLVERKPWLAGYFPHSLRKYAIGLDFDSRILDFGCGTGALLQTLHHFGFRNLTGVDAFIENDIVYPNAVKVYKRSLNELDEEFDLVMLHHSFEHLPEPAASLIEIKRVLSDDGYCLIRVPVVNYAWEKYGTNWVQMDPPRHLFLYTERALRKLAADAGFSVEHIYYDSGAFQFWGSEQYAKDIPLTDKRSYWIDPQCSLFTEKQIADWTAEADRSNVEERGDMACFYLRKRT